LAWHETRELTECVHAAGKYIDAEQIQLLLKEKKRRSRHNIMIISERKRCRAAFFLMHVQRDPLFEKQKAQPRSQWASDLFVICCVFKTDRLTISMNAARPFKRRETHSRHEKLIAKINDFWFPLICALILLGDAHRWIISNMEQWRLGVGEESERTFLFIWVIN
jgi:hypothetical protein